MNKYEVVESKINELFTPEDIGLLYQAKIIETKVNELIGEKKETIIELFKEYEVKSFECDKFVLIYKPETTKNQVDVKKLKEDGLYNKYLKSVPVKESLAIRMKYDD